MNPTIAQGLGDIPVDQIHDFVKQTGPQRRAEMRARERVIQVGDGPDMGIVIENYKVSLSRMSLKQLQREVKRVCQQAKVVNIVVAKHKLENNGMLPPLNSGEAAGAIALGEKVTSIAKEMARRRIVPEGDNQLGGPALSEFYSAIAQWQQERAREANEGGFIKKVGDALRKVFRKKS